MISSSWEAPPRVGRRGCFLFIEGAVLCAKWSHRCSIPPAVGRPPISQPLGQHAQLALWDSNSIFLMTSGVDVFSHAYYLLKIYPFLWKAGLLREKLKTTFLSPKCLQQPGRGEVRARSWELCAGSQGRGLSPGASQSLYWQ